MAPNDEILSRKHILVEDDRTGTSLETLRRAVLDNLYSDRFTFWEDLENRSSSLAAWDARRKLGKRPKKPPFVLRNFLTFIRTPLCVSFRVPARGDGVPYEFLEILVNEKQYGGGGIFNAQSTTSVDTEFAEYIFIHEFGHHFAGLADEYYLSPVSYETPQELTEPWEPNVTALHDPSNVKWAGLVEPGTPLPTPWGKEAYEEHAREVRARRQALIDAQAPEAEFDALFEEQKRIETELLATMRHSAAVGAFEGAMYEAAGLYRSETDCIMFTRDDVGFCRVCSWALERVMDLYAA